MDELQKIDLEFKIEDLKLKNELLQEELKDIDKVLFNDVKIWDAKFIYTIKKAAETVCHRNQITSNWADDIENKQISYIDRIDLRYDFIMKNYSVGFILLEIIYCNYESNYMDEVEKTLNDMEDLINKYFELFANEDPSYLEFIFDEVFNNTGIHDLYPYDVSFIEELKDSELFVLYLDFLNHIEMKKKQHTYEKKSKELEINSNKRKIELLEKRLGNTLITAI